jgi:predicted RNase H-like HicB family nuclease
MITDYIAAAMHHARYEILPDDGSFYGEVPGLQGVYATANTLEGCRDLLQEVLEGWILLGLHLHHPLPAVDGIDINVKASA